MKKIILLTACFLVSTLSFAQVKTPAPSPKATVMQMVGLTEVSLDYSRPSAKGRAVFGDLVPFGRIWRTGANQNTMVTFSDDVKIEGKKLPKGTYAIFATPKADIWEIVFYTDTQNWGTPEKWDDAKVALKTMVKPTSVSNHIETFTVAVNHLSNDAAHLELSWEKTMVAIKFDVPTQELAMASIDKALKGPGASDYFSAAQYFYSSEMSNPQALTYINKAVELATIERGETPFWYLRLQSLVQARSGDKKQAIATAKSSLVAAEKAGNADYAKMNRDSIAEWSKK
jgi:hypothetical protein